MKLLSLPDCKKLHPKLTLGKLYAIIRNVGLNGVVIELDDASDTIVILQERLG